MIWIGLLLAFALCAGSCGNKNHADHCINNTSTAKDTNIKIKAVLGPWEATKKETIRISKGTIEESTDTSRTTKHRKSPLKNKAKIK